MGNLASGHFKPTNNIQEQHNDRTLSPSYLIPQEFRGQNEVNRHSKQAMILKNQIIENAHETYLITFKQKSQAKSYQWSLVVNTKETTTMSDLEKLAEHFEIKYGFQCYQIAIHRDEGYMDENNQPHINHHAHMEFITLNKKNGKNMMRKAYLSPKNFREIQTEIAQILGMERGTDKRVSGTKRIEPHKYAQMKNKEREERSKDAKLIDELTNSMSELNAHATTLKQQIEAKNQKIDELQERPTRQELETKDKEISDLKDTNQEQATKNQALVKEITKLEKANQDLRRPSVWDTIKEKWIDATKNAKEVKELKQQNNKLLEENQKIGNEDLKNTIEIIMLKDNNNDLVKQNEKLKQENADLNNEITTALDTANSLWLIFKEPTLQKAVERNNDCVEKYLDIERCCENRNPDYVEAIVKKRRYDIGFINLLNALKELFSLRKWFANIKKILFGDENAEKDPKEIEQTIKELSERPTKTELANQRYYRKEAVNHYQEAEKIVFNGKTNSWILVTDDDAKKLNERLTELKEKESKLNTLENTDLALDLEKAQDRIKTLESNQTALKNDLNAKESAIQAKEKELNTLKQERTDLKDKLQAQEKTINELNKKFQELEDNYRLERERMVAENKRLKEQGLEKIYTQKDYEKMREAHHQEVEALKKQIQEYKTRSTTQETYTPTKRM
ncbi:hypothetical protein ACR9J1_07815 [Helicobacter pylori]